MMELFLGNQRQKMIKKLKVFLKEKEFDTLWIIKENKNKFFLKYKDDIEQGLYELNNYFIKFGTCARVFNELMGSFDNTNNSKNSLSSWLEWVVCPFIWFNK